MKAWAPNYVFVGGTLSLESKNVALLSSVQGWFLVWITQTTCNMLISEL